MWYVRERHDTRERFLRQKEINIERERKAGIAKEYVPVGINLLEGKSTLITQQKFHPAANTTTSHQNTTEEQTIVGGPLLQSLETTGPILEHLRASDEVVTG